MKRPTTCDDCKTMEKLLARAAHGQQIRDEAAKLLNDRYGLSWPKRLMKELSPDAAVDTYRNFNANPATNRQL